MASKVTEETYTDLNARLNLWTTNENGDKFIDFEVDKEATRQYFLTVVNPNTYHAYTLKEKLEFLFSNDYYEVEVFEQYGLKYDPESGTIEEDEAYQRIKELYQYVYSFKHRFESFLGAFKFFMSYALKTFDGKTWLERVEERVVATALLLGRGDMSLAREIAKEHITGSLQSATPTFLNAGKKSRGEYVSCFPAGTAVAVKSTNRVMIEDIKKGDRVLTHTGSEQPVSKVITNIYNDDFIKFRAGGMAPVTSTKNHPILVWIEHPSKDTRPVIIDSELPTVDTEHFKWVAAEDLIVGVDWIISQKQKTHFGYFVDAPNRQWVRYPLKEKEVVVSDGPTKVYNLEVANDHTYHADLAIVHNCFLIRTEDNMESISRTSNAALQLSKRGGGVGINLTNIRESGAPIKNIEGASSGIIPVAKILEDDFSYANQLG